MIHTRWRWIIRFDLADEEWALLDPVNQCLADNIFSHSRRNQQQWTFAACRQWV